MASSMLKDVLAVGLGLALCAGSAIWVSAQDDPATAREVARNSACMTNMKHLATGMIMYVQDYDERYPPAGKWQTGVFPYIKNRRVFQCPSDSGSPSYAFNRALSGIAEGRVRTPSEMVMLFESDLHKPNAAGGVQAVDRAPHGGGSNYARMDGSVKWSTTPLTFGVAGKKK